MKPNPTSQTAGATAPRIIPDGESVRHRLADLWPGGTLALVKRMPGPNPSDEPIAVYRLSKDGDAVLIFVDLIFGSRISSVRTTPDREYDW